MDSKTVVVGGTGGFIIGVFWAAWTVYGFWWGLLYGFGWSVWFGYRAAMFLLGS